MHDPGFDFRQPARDVGHAILVAALASALAVSIGLALASVMIR